MWPSAAAVHELGSKISHGMGQQNQELDIQSSQISFQENDDQIHLVHYFAKDLFNLFYNSCLDLLHVFPGVSHSGSSFPTHYFQQGLALTIPDETGPTMLADQQCPKCEKLAKYTHGSEEYNKVIYFVNFDYYFRNGCSAFPVASHFRICSTHKVLKTVEL
ncbi:hypothetical protein BDQ17DRAFT_1329352 [Cyathus striatus]|nr:hypothetical protein BDQ17DRAFT_1329352 [Cyathus striatus]